MAIGHLLHSAIALPGWVGGGNQLVTVHYILAMHSRQICSYSDWPPTAAPVINSSAPAAVRRVGHCYQPWTSEVAAEAGLTGTTADRDQRLLDHHHGAAQSVSGVKLHWLSQPLTAHHYNCHVWWVVAPWNFLQVCRQWCISWCRTLLTPLSPANAHAPLVLCTLMSATHTHTVLDRYWTTDLSAGRKYWTGPIYFLVDRAFSSTRE